MSRKLYTNMVQLTVRKTNSISYSLAMTHMAGKEL